MHVFSSVLYVILQFIREFVFISHILFMHYSLSCCVISYHNLAFNDLQLYVYVCPFICHSQLQYMHMLLAVCCIFAFLQKNTGEVDIITKRVTNLVLIF